MLQTYEAIYEHGIVRWLDGPPEMNEARLLVTVLSGPVATSATTDARRSNDLANALKAAVLLNPYRDVVDSVAWQREVRDDRALPGRN
jgi:hypothetical protein